MGPNAPSLPSGDPADAPSVDRSRRLILEAIGDTTDVSLVLAGSLASGGLAAEGARRLLSGGSYRELRIEELAGARGEVALLLGDGFSRADHDVMPRALAIAELRFARVIVLPSSLDPSEDTVHRVLSETQAIVFARELDSYRGIADLCDTRLAHDCAFFFDYSRYTSKGAGVLNAFGADFGQIVGMAPTADNDDVSVPDLQTCLNRIAAHETVRTDRVQVMIAAALMGKRVEYAQGLELGVEAIASGFLADRPVASIAAPVREQPLTPASLDPTVEDTLAALTSAALAVPAERRAPSDARVTAVLLTRDRPQLLLRALSSLEREHGELRTLVIDNNSSPDAARALEEACRARTNVELRRSARNLGCGGGRALGARLADTEYVLFLDDDAELTPGAVDHLLLVLDRQPGVGAVSATVVEASGVVFHSGGSLELDDEMATFSLLCNSSRFSDSEIPPSGPCGWCPGTAMLVRRALLQELPINETMGAHFEDNEWCYRVSRERPGSFWRSREALVLHNSRPKEPPGFGFASRSRAVEFLASYARFYELHGLLLGPWLFDHHLPELRASDGTPDTAAAKLLMELMLAKGSDWTLMSWMNGDLDGLLRSRRLRVLEADLAREKDGAQRLREEALEFRVEAERVHARKAEVEEELQGAWQKLRRIEDSLAWRSVQRVRRGVFTVLGGEGSRGVALLRRGLRRVGRGSLSGRNRSGSPG